MADESTTTGTLETPAQTAPATSSETQKFSWDSLALSPEMKQLVADRKWESVDVALNSYRNLEKLTGVPADQIIKLPKDNDPKAWDAVYNRLGRPESADKYTVTVPEGQSDEFAKVAKGWFHESGLSQSQATKLAEKWNGFVADQLKTAEAEQTQKNQVSINELKQAWGADYDKRAVVVDRAAEAFGMNQDQLAALKQVLGPKGAMEFLHNIGSKVAVEDGRPAGMSRDTSASSEMSPESAQAKIAELRRDKDFAALYNSHDVKQRMEARQQMERLTKIAYPGMTAL